MSYLNHEVIGRFEQKSFRATKPYPFWNPQGLLTPEGFERLRATLPEPSRFEAQFGVPRKYEQKSHDRYTLEYHAGLDLPVPWRDFIAELRSRRYRRFLRRALGVGPIELGFHWHYTPTGCSISPHCDSRRKAGSQLFYFNTEADWKPAWGGQTLILDDGGDLSRASSPAFEDFRAEMAVEIMGNRSALFSAGPHSWHGMRELTCPEGALRRVFIVVFNKAGPLRRLKRRLKGKPLSGY